MLTIEEIRERLQDRRINYVVRATGLSRITVHNIRTGRQTRPRYETLLALSQYLSGSSTDARD